MYIVKYVEDGTIEGYVDSKKMFSNRLIEMNKQRIDENEIEFEEDEFILEEINKF